MTRQVMTKLERDRPRTTALMAYLDADETELSIVHLFGDAEAMDRHVDGATERAQTAYELMEPRGWEIYGSPSEAALESMRRAADAAGVELRLHPSFTDGFLRTGVPQAV